MGKETAGFTAIITQDEFTRLGCNRIAGLLGLPQKEVIPNEVIQFSTVVYALQIGMVPLISPAIFRRVTDKYAGNSDDNRLNEERCQAILQAADLIRGGLPGFTSYGISFPSYKQELEKQKETWGEAESYKSLLIGASTKDTTDEYTAGVRSIFPKAQTYIIDVEGRETTKAQGFLFGSGLSIPFSDNSFSSIHTNCLLPKLKGKNIGNKTKLEQLFAEMYRVLSDQGQLIMFEDGMPDAYGDGYSFQKAIEQIEGLLKQQGFKKFALQTAEIFSSRQDMLRYFRSNHNEEINSVCGPTDSFLITATKQSPFDYTKKKSDKKAVEPILL